VEEAILVGADEPRGRAELFLAFFHAGSFPGTASGDSLPNRILYFTFLDLYSERAKSPLTQPAKTQPTKTQPASAGNPELIADYACETGENPLWHTNREAARLTQTFPPGGCYATIRTPGATSSAIRAGRLVGRRVVSDWQRSSRGAGILLAGWDCIDLRTE
jgi:hypothetical protein